MSIANLTLGEAPIAGQQGTPKATKAPIRRLATAKADTTVQPEAR